MKNTILVIQIIISIVLIILILIQSKGSSGLGRGFSGGSSFSRRGLEKLLYKLTFVFAALFVLVSLISLAI